MKLAKIDYRIYLGMSIFWLVALFNPFFMKYDYGAGFPLVIVFCVLLVMGATKLFGEKSEKATLERFCLFIFGLFLVLSFIFSETRNIGLSEVMAWLSVILLYRFVAYRKVAWMGRFLAVLMVSSVLAVILGYVLYFVWPEVRMQGPFFNILYHANVWPNAFALFLLTIWPLFLTVKLRWLKIVLIALIVSALLLTFSRGAAIVLGGQFGLLLAYHIRKINWRKTMTVIGVGALSVALFLSANYLRGLSHEVVDVEERVNFKNSEGLTSKQERIDFWLGALQLAKERPLFGWGPSSFRQAYGPIQKTFLGNADHPHNVFLKIGAENGMIAVSAFIAFLLAVLSLLGSRFKKLNQGEKDFAYILFVAIAGAFAHNLIDYNLNFYVNLLLLFLLLAFLRSLLVAKVGPGRPIFSYGVAVLLALLAIFEGSLLVMDESVYDKSFLGNSFFPRSYYLESAEKVLYLGDLETGIVFANKQIELNGLDAQAYYLRGAAQCDLGNMLECKDDFESAIMLNPLNEWGYYLDYFRLLEGDERLEFVEKVSPTLELYFDYVENNVHFTAYTPNVETAAELVEQIAPYLSDENQVTFLERADQMLKTAEKLREDKIF